MFGFWHLGRVDWELDDDDLPRLSNDLAPVAVTVLTDVHDEWFDGRCSCGEDVQSNDFLGHLQRSGVDRRSISSGGGAAGRWADIMGERESA